MKTYQQNKINIYNWREIHREEYNEYMRKVNLEKYYNNKEKFSKQRKEYYLIRKDPYLSQCKIFRNILL